MAPTSEAAFEADQHALRALERHGLRGEDVRELARSAPEGERANPADGAGMAVGHGMGRAGQHHAELGRDHMRDPLLGIGDVEQPDAMAAAAFAHRLEERRARGIGVVVAAGQGRNRMVLHGEGEVRPAHRPLFARELLEGMRRVQLMQHMPVDIDEVAPVRAPRHAMRVPDLIEQRLRHEGALLVRFHRRPVVGASTTACKCTAFVGRNPSDRTPIRNRLATADQCGTTQSGEAPVVNGRLLSRVVKRTEGRTRCPTTN